MTSDNDTLSAGRDLVARMNEKIQHLNEMIAQKLEYQNKFLEQRLDIIDKVNAEKMLGFSARLEEALAEIRGYRDILQQQLVLLDSSIKKAYGKIEELDNRGTSRSMAEVAEIRKELEEGLQELEVMMENVQKIQTTQHDEALLQRSRANDPIRIFLKDNGKQVLIFVLSGLGLYILKNMENILAALRSSGSGS